MLRCLLLFFTLGAGHGFFLWGEEENTPETTPQPEVIHVYHKTEGVGHTVHQGRQPGFPPHTHSLHHPNKKGPIRILSSPDLSSSRPVVHHPHYHALSHPNAKGPIEQRREHIYGPGRHHGEDSIRRPYGGHGHAEIVLGRREGESLGGLSEKPSRGATFGGVRRRFNHGESFDSIGGRPIQGDSFGRLGRRESLGGPRGGPYQDEGLGRPGQGESLYRVTRKLHDCHDKESHDCHHIRFRRGAGVQAKRKQSPINTRKSGKGNRPRKMQKSPRKSQTPKSRKPAKIHLKRKPGNRNKRAANVDQAKQKQTFINQRKITKKGAGPRKIQAKIPKNRKPTKIHQKRNPGRRIRRAALNQAKQRQTPPNQWKIGNGNLRRGAQSPGPRRFNQKLAKNRKSPKLHPKRKPGRHSQISTPVRRPNRNIRPQIQTSRPKQHAHVPHHSYVKKPFLKRITRDVEQGGGPRKGPGRPGGHRHGGPRRPQSPHGPSRQKVGPKGPRPRQVIHNALALGANILTYVLS